MERPCLEMGAKNHSTVNLRLLLKRSWNCLNYSRSIRGAGDKLKLCSFAFTPCGSVWCGSPSTIPTTLLLWSIDILRVDSSTVGPSPVSARSLENLKNDAPIWYTEDHHKRALNAWRILQKPKLSAD